MKRPFISDFSVEFTAGMTIKVVIVMSIVSYYEFEIATLVFGLLIWTPTSSTGLSKYFNLFFKFHFLLYFAPSL